MALTNFILTVAGVGALVLLLRGDVKQTAAVFRRNARQVRQWLKEESASASNSAGVDDALHQFFLRIGAKHNAFR